MLVEFNKHTKCLVLFVFLTRSVLKIKIRICHFYIILVLTLFENLILYNMQTQKIKL